MNRMLCSAVDAGVVSEREGAAREEKKQDFTTPGFHPPHTRFCEFFPPSHRMGGKYVMCRGVTCGRHAQTHLWNSL